MKKATRSDSSGFFAFYFKFFEAPQAEEGAEVNRLHQNFACRLILDKQKPPYHLARRLLKDYQSFLTINVGWASRRRASSLPLQYRLL